MLACHAHRWSACLTAVITAFLGIAVACGSEAEDPAPKPPRPVATVNIMPLGDFVGSRHGVGNGSPAYPDFDMDHEGHAGWKADEILFNVESWAAAASPDIVLLHVGHNDLCRGQSVASTIMDISDIVDVLRTVKPRIRILLAQLIASASSCHAGIPALNARLAALVADKDRPESPVVLVDQYTGFDPSVMTYDGTHPNAMGDSHMAERWFEKLAPVLDGVVTQN
jgi:acyl-CoA thioesterase-1